MRPFKLKERECAIKSGVEFIYKIACDEDYFALYGQEVMSVIFVALNPLSAIHAKIRELKFVEL